MKTGGIILAGGKGSRMGREKAWVEICGSTLLQRAVSNLEFLQSEIIIVKAPGGTLPPVSATMDLKIVQDAVGGKGPLAGIAAGLANAEYSHNLVIACDMPLLNRRVLEYLVSEVKDYDAIIPCDGDKPEPLQAIYSKACIPEIEKLLAQNRLKIDNLFSFVRTYFIESAKIDYFDPEHLSFFNVNTPADLQKATRILCKD